VCVSARAHDRLLANENPQKNINKSNSIKHYTKHTQPYTNIERDYTR
jgi:hypothetical protein